MQCHAHECSHLMSSLISFFLCVHGFGRELAYQIADQFRVFGTHIGLKDAVIVGGIGELINKQGKGGKSLRPL